ncbi:Glutathione S-transferase 2 [Elasticomyces elasticus]|uniref:Glutathione S-transferase 2 n=1 Tax=Exophiala sideris TaxID=1016849 RepID=A0ABR0JRY3_9EURO|nr:Glutathione S-transferase 2 [Elasticomyces elasticus]KAK5040333.1 Glutathione S-transferase 2 [Exophiala sideris]KAK5043241.1 Glutathione S-transferase 2 [Exophiala sideris]KAK5068711.1 Glutathione S-transferase 2 [Exophiala sideris]KAK5186309.1 Glutathione S-transferase 2 [Eurotiomycetes sp. CCFEE 6388]
MSSRPDITLYTDSTPNGIKISIGLEELGLPYKTEHINISTNKQKEPWFLEINPNGRIPAITDTFSDGQKIRIFEGGSILQYLAEEYDKDHKISYPKGSREYYEVNNWLFFQHGGLGPMQGQANHFVRYAPEKIEYGVNRYVNETRRLYGVLDKHLQSSKSGFIVGDHISIADITTIGWVMWAAWAGVEIDEFPTLKKWEEMMLARPGVKKGSDVPKPLNIKERLKDKDAADKYAKESSSWIVQGMQDDKRKHGS